MLIHFRCRDVPTVTMFGDHGQALLRLMGQSGEVPGGLLAPDVPAALERLKASIAAGQAASRAPAPGHPGDAGDAPAPTLRSRAGPLIDFLERAVASGADLTWTG